MKTCETVLGRMHALTKKSYTVVASAVPLNGYKRITTAKVTAQKMPCTKVVCPLTMLRSNGRSAAAHSVHTTAKMSKRFGKFQILLWIFVSERANCT